MKVLTAFILVILSVMQAKTQVLFSYAGPQTPITTSYFGQAYGHLGQTSPTCFTTGTATSFTQSFDTGFSWNFIETSSGVFDYTTADALYSAYTPGCAPDFLFIAGGVPAWNASDGSSANAPNASPAAFVGFMNSITQHYCGKIQYWSGWNEANTPATWNASVALLATYMNAMYTAVHSTANCACVGGFGPSTCSPGKTSGVNLNSVLLPPLDSPAQFTTTEQFPGCTGCTPNNYNLTYWLENYLTAAGTGSFDIAALHSYGSNGTCYTGGPEAFVTDLQSFRQVLSAAGKLVPVWNTEMNWGQNVCIAGNSDSIKNSWIARQNLLGWAIGIQRVLWYAYDYNGKDDPNGFGEIEPGTTQLTTYQDMQLWMTGAVQQNCQQFANNNWSCAFTRTSPSGYQAYAAWNSTGTGSYTVPAGVIQYRDVLNNITSTTGGATVSLTASPLLFETVAGAF